MATVPRRCGTFNVETAIRLIASTAARVGMPVELDRAMASLRAAFPDLAMSDLALRRELLKVADRAQIAVNCGTETSASADSMSMSKPVGALKPLGNRGADPQVAA